MGRVSRARWIIGAGALALIVACALAIVDYAMEPSGDGDAVATPVNAQEWKAKGDRLLAAGDIAGALAAYDEALVLAPDDFTVCYRAGVALSHLGDREQAAALFLQVVRTGPADHDEVRRARAWLQAAEMLPAEDAASRR